MKRKKYFDWESAFHFVRQDEDHEGMWRGDAASLAAEFEVEDTADSALDDLCARRLIEKVYTGTFSISKWRDKDEPDTKTATRYGCSVRAQSDVWRTA